jgi:hypothetical protein
LENDKVAKKDKKKNELKRFSVETVSTFYEVHVVFAENEEMAKKIASQTDYNLSKWLGEQVVNVREAKDKDIERFKETDEYFFEGASAIDDEGSLVYTDLEGNFVRHNDAF